MRSPLATAGALLGLVLASCERVEVVLDQFRDLTPHEAYLAALEQAGLAETALGRDWAHAARSAVESPHPVDLPFREEGYLTPEEPTAVAYRFGLQRGQVLTIRAELEASDAPRVFLDLFRVQEDADDPLRPVQDVDTIGGTLVFEPGRRGDYLLRLQPELLRGGRYRLTLSLNPALAFPVEGFGPDAIRSPFGAARDGGRRAHHGVDIFAPRGTPAIAAAPGVVSRVQVTGLGGKVVWIRDDRRGASLYYAHLDSQTVARGDRVLVGDTVGFVGNTGNARTTAPHLHFGIYSRGAVDPDPFIRPPRRSLPALTASPDLLGGWARTRDAGALRPGPEGTAPDDARLDPGAPVRVLGGAGAWYRVRLPDGRTGWIPVGMAEALNGPLREWVPGSPARVRAAPLADAPVVLDVGVGTPLPVLGAFGGFAWVEAPGGVRGWVEGEG